MQTKKERSKDWFEPNVFWCLYLPFNQIKALKKVGLATPTRTKENINNWVAVWWLLTNLASAAERSGQQLCVTHVFTLDHDWLFKLLLQWYLLAMVSKKIATQRQSQLFVAVITISVASIFILFTRQSSYAFIPSLPSLPRMQHLPRVLCWVNTHPANHMKKAVHVAATWGRWDMGFEFGRRCSRNRTTFHWICQWLHEIYIFMGSPEFYLSVSGVATNCCSWAQQRMRESEALLFPISPTDAPLFGTRLKRSKKTYFLSLTLNHYPRHLFMFGSTTERRQIGS